MLQYFFFLGIRAFMKVSALLMNDDGPTQCICIYFFAHRIFAILHNIIYIYTVLTRYTWVDCLYIYDYVNIFILFYKISLLKISNIYLELKNKLQSFIETNIATKTHTVYAVNFISPLLRIFAMFLLSQHNITAAWHLCIFKRFDLLCISQLNASTYIRKNVFAFCVFVCVIYDRRIYTVALYSTI